MSSRRHLATAQIPEMCEVVDRQSEVAICRSEEPSAGPAVGCELGTPAGRGPDQVVARSQERVLRDRAEQVALAFFEDVSVDVEARYVHTPR